MARLTVMIAALAIMFGGFHPWPSISSISLLGNGGAQAQSGDDVIDTSTVFEATLGDVHAPLTVVEYASFTCPHCQSFHQNVFKRFRANYIDTGKVHFVFREVYFDRFGLWASIVARCGGPERFFDIADQIFEKMNEWTRGGGREDIVENLVAIGRMNGLTKSELDSCLTDGNEARAMVAVYQENVERDGVRSTPTFMIDGDAVTGDMSYEKFASLLDAKLGD